MRRSPPVPRFDSPIVAAPAHQFPEALGPLCLRVRHTCRPLTGGLANTAFIGEGERFEVFTAEAIRLLAIFTLLPLVKSRRRNETSPFCKSLAKQRQLVHRLSPRVDMRNPRLLLHPKWDQSPACHDHLALAVAGVDAYPQERTFVSALSMSALCQ
jgi:hypothetical protein